MIIGRGCCVAIFSDTGNVLVVRQANGLFGLPGGECEEGETPMAAVRRETREETRLRLKAKLARVLVATAGLHRCFGYLYTETISPYTLMTPEPGCSLEWRHPSMMDADDARFWLYNREFFAILKGTGFVDVLPGADLEHPEDPSKKFYVKMNLGRVQKDLEREEMLLEQIKAA